MAEWVCENAAAIGARLTTFDTMRSAAQVRESAEGAQDFAKLLRLLNPLITDGVSVEFLHHYIKLTETRQLRAAATGDGLLVVDVDGEEAAFAFTDLVNESGVPWPIRTPTTLTGRGVLRVHYYLATPPGVVLGNTAGKLCKGVDTRGDGGYVVAPPSIHPDSGDPYNWVVSPSDERLAPVPEWLVELLLRDDDDQLGARGPFKVADTTSPLGARILGEECARISAAPKGERNHTTFARSAAVGNLVAGGLILLSEATSHLTEAAVASGLAPVEAQTVVANGLIRGLETLRQVGEPHP